jgi:heme oxygenase
MAELIPFSQALRERTSAVHRESEGATFMQDLMSGQGCREDYILLLSQHYFIYEALEQAAAGLSGDPVAGLFISPKLTRLPAIEADLEFLLGQQWRDRVAPLDSTLRYTERIREVGRTWPGGFVAHHYTRYLGDLSGGQIIRTLLQRQYGFETNGVGFYLFADIAKPKLFKDTYRAQLDAVDWSDEERDRVIDEVSLAFRFNTDLFDDLAATKAAA